MISPSYSIHLVCLLLGALLLQGFITLYRGTAGGSSIDNPFLICYYCHAFLENMALTLNDMNGHKPNFETEASTYMD